MNAATSPVLLGLDPGYGRLGWAVGRAAGQSIELLECGCIETAKELELSERYHQLGTELSAIIERLQPTVAGVEKLFFSSNQKTALQVAEARGVILRELKTHQLEILEFNPTQIKVSVTGDGHAPKAAVIKMVRMEVKLPPNVLDDTVDAIACLLTLRWHLGRVRWST